MLQTYLLKLDPREPNSTFLDSVRQRIEDTVDPPTSVYGSDACRSLYSLRLLASCSDS